MDFINSDNLSLIFSNCHIENQYEECNHSRQSHHLILCAHFLAVFDQKNHIERWIVVKLTIINNFKTNRLGFTPEQNETGYIYGRRCPGKLSFSLLPIY
jgi:hypothetical protein